jgi:hypothetical protein
MNKILAAYLFSNETLFVQDTKSVSTLNKDLHSEIKLETKDELAPTPIKNTTKTNWVFINNPDSAQLQLLEKILSSVKLNLKDVELVDVSKNNFKELISSLSNGKNLVILSFGVAMSKLSLEFLLFPYQTKEINGNRFLLVDDLLTINNNQKDEKKLLWVSLKEMFGL